MADDRRLSLLTEGQRRGILSKRHDELLGEAGKRKLFSQTQTVNRPPTPTGRKVLDTADILKQGIENVKRAATEPRKFFAEAVNNFAKSVSPEALEANPEKVLDFINPMAASIRAFHGSPFKFRTFDARKIGTGEGAQAFGHGLYFTEGEDIARAYAGGFHPTKYRLGKKDVGIASGEEAIALQKLQEGVGSFRRAKDRVYMTDFSPERKGRLVNIIDEWDRKGVKLKEHGNIYSVAIHKGKTPDQYDYLRWDERITPNVINKVEKAILKLNRVREKLGKELIDPKYVITDGNIVRGKVVKQRGEALYTRLSAVVQGTENASNFLLEAGIDGIKYPSGTLSGIKGSDKFNYVVFDPNAVTIETINKLK